jgi:hypothetical protein
VILMWCWTEALSWLRANTMIRAPWPEGGLRSTVAQLAEALAGSRQIFTDPSVERSGMTTPAFLAVNAKVAVAPAWLEVLTAPPEALP